MFGGSGIYLYLGPSTCSAAAALPRLPSCGDECCVCAWWCVWCAWGAPPTQSPMAGEGLLLYLQPITPESHAQISIASRLPAPWTKTQTQTRGGHRPDSPQPPDTELPTEHP